ncbi:hypothetical protein LTR81_024249 [Elasticomyces elasticus]
MAATAAVKKKKGATRGKKPTPVESTIWQPPPAHRPDILMTLPPELRNQIYLEVLEAKFPIAMHPEGMPRKAYGAQWQPWREPPLLQVSKVIRGEATSIYYGDNDFDISITLSRAPGLCARLRRLVERCGSKPFRPLRIKFTNADWSSMSNGRVLGMLFYETGLQAPPCVRTGEPVRDDDDPKVHMISSGHNRIESLLRLVVESGEKGARESWSRAKMDHKLSKWADLCSTAGTKGIYSLAWYREKAALQA